MSELLLPAGSLAKMKTAILYGADAVYAGTPDMSLRTKSAFSLEELVEGIDFAHKNNVRVYLTLNLYSHDHDIQKLPGFLETIRSVRPDGLIIADPGIFQYVSEHAPEIPLHISTQANVSSSLTVRFWEKLGAKLVVLARECSFAEISAIKKNCPNIKIEAFVHGAMCMAHSGRCLLSNFMAERGANQWNCAQSCRWKYKVHVKLADGATEELEITEENKDLVQFFLEEEFRPGEFMEITEDAFGSYIMNAKDLCLMPVLWEYLAAGIDSLKVEGRNKTQYYAAVVGRAYRFAIETWKKDPQNFDPTPFMMELLTLQNRGYTLGFHGGRLTNLGHNYDHAKSTAHYEFSWWIREWQGDDIIFELKNSHESMDAIEFLSPYQFAPIRLRLASFTDADTGEITQKVSAGQKKAIRIPAQAFSLMDTNTLREMLPPYTVARKEQDLNTEDAMRLMLDVQAQNMEIESYKNDSGASVASVEDLPEYKKYLMAREIARNEQQKLIGAGKPNKNPKVGGCCGRGCNGCLIFAHDEQYAEARKKLQDKKPGEMLEKRILFSEKK